MPRSRSRSNLLLWCSLLLLGCIAGVLGSATYFSISANFLEKQSKARAQQLSEQLAKSTQAVAVLKRQIASKATEHHQPLSVDQIEKQLDIALEENRQLQRKLDQIRSEEIPSQLQIVADKVADDVVAVAKAINVNNKRPTIIRAVSVNSVNFEAFNPHSLLLVGALVRNDTNTAISKLQFYVQVRDPNRQVPHGETISVVPVLGGIEPGETKQIQVSIPSFELNLPHLQAVFALPPNNQVFLSIVQNEDFESDKTYYEMFAKLPQSVAPYTAINRPDPNLEALLNLKFHPGQ